MTVVVVGNIDALIGRTADVPATAVELLLFMTIGGLARLNHRRNWHERWIDYRLLAELCRKQAILSPLGFKLPRSEIMRIAAETSDEKTVQAPKASWIAWYVEAALRSAPLPDGDSARRKRRVYDLGLALVRSQERYHRERSARCEHADRRLGKLGKTCFLATVGLVVVRLVLSSSGRLCTLSDLSVLSAAMLSAASAAFVALRFYAEFGFLARLSSRMWRLMSYVENELAAIDLNVPLSSLELGRTLESLSISMLQDMAGWAELFRIRAVEAS